MTVFSERDGLTILDVAADADGDQLTVVKINGQSALVGVPIPLSVGGVVTVTLQGEVTFDDTGFSVPEIGDYVGDSLIVTVTDGTVETDTNVLLKLYGAASEGAAVFGALTRPFEGGVPAPEGATVIDAGDPQGHFAISGGMILPTLAGSGRLSGEYVLTMDTGATQEIIVLPDTFSVAGDTQLSALLNDADRPYDGKRILLRSGQYGLHQLPAQTFAHGVTIEGEPGASVQQVWVRQLSGAPDVTFRGLTFATDTVETTPVVRLFTDTNATPNGSLNIEDCRFEGHAGIDPNSDVWVAKVGYSGLIGTFQVGEELTGENGGPINMPILEVHDNGDGTGVLWLSDNPSGSTYQGGSANGNRLAPGVTLTGVISGATLVTTTGLYGGDPSLGDGIGGGLSFANVYVNGCVFIRLRQALKVNATQAIEIVDNLCTECQSDFIKTNPLGNTPPADHFHIKRNIHMKAFGRGEDKGNPHVDSIQFLFGTMDVDFTGLEITDNIFMLGGRCYQTQSIFLSGGRGGGSLDGAVIANNIFDNGSGAQIRIPRWRNGTIIGNIGAPLTVANDPERVFLLGETYADANSVFLRNVTEGINYYTVDGGGGYTSDPAGNYTPGKNADWGLAYANLTGMHAETVTDLLTQLVPDSDGPVMAGNGWDFGVDLGCVTETGRFISASGMDITDVLLATEMRASQSIGVTSGSVPDQLTAFTVTRNGSTTVDLDIVMMPSANGAPITGLDIFVNGSYQETVAITTVGAYVVDIGTSVTADVAIAVRNSIGQGLLSAEVTVAGVSVSSIAVDDFAIDAWPYDLRGVFGESTAKIPVSGSITPGTEGVAIRARRAGSGDVGEIIGTTATDGSFSGAMGAVESSGAYNLEVFVDGHASINAVTSNTYATGHVMTVWAQSEVARIFDFQYDAQDSPAAEADPVVADINSMVYLNHDHINDTVPSVVRLGDEAATGHMKHMANVYAQVAPGKRFAVIDQCQSGTSMYALMDDSKPNRDWVDTHAVYDFLRNIIKDTNSFNQYVWWAADRGRMITFTNALDYMMDTVAPYFFKELGDGTPISLGDTHPHADTSVGDVDHVFYDNSVASDQRGEGLFARDEAKFMFAVNGFIEVTGATPLTDLEDQGMNVTRRLQQNLRWWLANDTRTTDYGFEEGFGIHHLRVGKDIGVDTTHPTNDDRHGLSLAGEMLVINHLKALGIVTATIPAITDATWTVNDVTVDVKVGVGNRLTTYRDELALGAVDAEAHRAPLAGFEIWNGSSYEHPTAIAITDDGSATGTAQIVITRANSDGDVLSFMRGGGTGQLMGDDMVDQYHLNIPSVALAGVINPLVPVQVFPEGGYLTAVGLGAGGGDPFVTTAPAYDTYYRDTANFASNVLTAEFRIKPDLSEGNALISMTGGQLVLDHLGSGIMRLTVKAGVTLLLNGALSTNALAQGADQVVRLVVDLPNGRAQILIDDVVALDQSFVSGLSFQTNRKIDILANNMTNPYHGAFNRLQLWKGAETSGGDYITPTVPLYKAIVTPASSANAPSGWVKHGSDVTDM